ncbi:hypothetical protein Pve01_85130 [Planomonospora venezuelensis]|nr:hypothetical protein Pve01_85130 [Planomonospora venezuelensis]
MGTATNTVSTTKVDEWMLWATAVGVGVTFLIGLGSICVAVLANGKAKRANALASTANTIAEAAREDARRAALDSRWAEALAAVAPFHNVDLRHDDVRPLLNRLRPALQMLVDGLRSDDFAAWVHAEMLYGLALLRAANTGAPPVGVEETLGQYGPVYAWAGAFTDNLRNLWRNGYNGPALIALAKVATERRSSVYERHGWPEEESPYTPLDLDDA